jgi:uncharacterized protein (TIGR02996 family)
VDEEAGFVAAILADPADDLAGLAFADWLDERGDPRAEYFRLRHQLRALEPDNRAGTRRRKSELRLRIRAALAGHWVGLRGCLPTRGVLLGGSRYRRRVRLEGAFRGVLEWPGFWSGLWFDAQRVVASGGASLDRGYASDYALTSGGQTRRLTVMTHEGWFRLLAFDLLLDGELVYAEGEFPEHR